MTYASFSFLYAWSILKKCFLYVCTLNDDEFEKKK